MRFVPLYPSFVTVTVYHDGQHSSALYLPIAAKVDGSSL